MEIKDILSLIQAVSDHGLTEFKLDDGDVKLSLKKECMAPATAVMPGLAAGVPTVLSQGEAVNLSAQNGAVSSGHNEAEFLSDKVVASPLVGTFYSASSPGAESFVKVGDTVKKGQVLGIVEAMKLMNEIESEYDGVVEAILVNNEDVVEFGQPLFRIR